jgi:hypothetical protein
MPDSFDKTGFSRAVCGDVLASRAAMSVDLLIGRGLAFCVHPTAAWRVLSTPGRAFVVAAYAGAAYVAVLGALLLA